MGNKRFFKNLMTGAALTGTGFSFIQAQVSNVVRADGFELPPIVVSWAKVMEKKVMEGGNLFNTGFYDGLLRVVWLFKKVFGIEMEHDKKWGINTFKDFKRDRVDRDFSGAAFCLSYHLDLKNLEFESLLNDPSVSKEDKEELEKIIKETERVKKGLKVLIHGEGTYNEELYNKILDKVVDKAAILTDWDTVLIDAFCKERLFDNDESKCKEFFSKYKDKGNYYFKMGNDLLEKCVKKLEEKIRKNGDPGGLIKSTLKDYKKSGIAKGYLLNSALAKEEVGSSAGVEKDGLDIFGDPYTIGDNS